MTNGHLGQWPDSKPAEYQLIAVIRSLIDSTNPTFLEHALEQMDKRGFDTIDVLNVLRTGDIVGGIEPGKNSDEWKCKVVACPHYPDNLREIGVVTIVVRASYLLIKTVEWED